MAAKTALEHAFRLFVGKLFGAQPRVVAIATDDRTGVVDHFVIVHSGDFEEASENLDAGLLFAASCGGRRSRNSVLHATILV